MLFAENQGDENGPVVLLLHGLGVNGAVWDAVRAVLPASLRVIAPDFAGHGLSARKSNYSLGGHAADVAALLPPGAKIRVIGHSMGGAVGLLLATGWFGVTVERLVSVGMKLNWTQEEVAKMGRPFPVRKFDTRKEAAERFLAVTGLAGIMPAEGRVVERGVVEEAGRWRLAADPETVRVVGPETPAMIAAARASGTAIQLVCGSRDALVSLPEMRHFDPSALTIDGGHNAHVENADAIVELIG